MANTKMIMREADKQELDETIGGRKVSNIRYADDTVVIAESEENLQIMLDRVRKSREDYGLRINAKKTKAMLI